MQELKCVKWIEVHNDLNYPDEWKLCNQYAFYMIEGNSLCFTHAQHAARNKSYKDRI